MSDKERTKHDMERLAGALTCPSEFVVDAMYPYTVTCERFAGHRSTHRALTPWHIEWSSEETGERS